MPLQSDTYDAVLVMAGGNVSAIRSLLETYQGSANHPILFDDTISGNQIAPDTLPYLPGVMPEDDDTSIEFEAILLLRRPLDFGEKAGSAQHLGFTAKVMHDNGTLYIQSIESDALRVRQSQAPNASTMPGNDGGTSASKLKRPVFTGDILDLDSALHITEHDRAQLERLLARRDGALLVEMNGDDIETVTSAQLEQAWDAQLSQSRSQISQDTGSEIAPNQIKTRRKSVDPVAMSRAEVVVSVSASSVLNALRRQEQETAIRAHPDTKQQTSLVSISASARKALLSMVQSQNCKTLPSNARKPQPALSILDDPRPEY